MIEKKLTWIVKRHPFLYLTRFRLLSKNAPVEALEKLSYNRVNGQDDIPCYFKEINSLIFQSGTPRADFELVVQLSVWLFEHIKGGPGLSAASNTALKIMLAGQGGVCSDIAQVFNNFCVLNNIEVREWGTTRAPFDKGFGGHSFNEVYSKELNKWLLIDVYSCLVFYGAKQDRPLSVTELYRCLWQGEKVMCKSFNSKKIVDEQTVYRNFLHPDTIPFLIYNYSNKTYDYYLERFRPYLPVFVIHFWLYLRKKSYYYLFPLKNYKVIFS